MPKLKPKRPGLRRDKKARAPSKQPICGLYAAAKCAGILLKTAADVQAFREQCFVHRLLHKHSGNWVGGTTERERVAICEHFGCKVSASHDELVHGRRITVKTLLKNAQFFKTQAQYMLEVHKHVVHVRTNGTKKAIRVCDQSGQQMSFVNVQGLPDQKLEKLLGQRVVSLTLVTPSKT